MDYNLNYINANGRKEFLQATSRTEFSNKELGVGRFDNAVILPARTNTDGDFNVLGGVLDSNGSFVSSSAWTQNANGAYEFNNSQLDVIDKAIYIGNHVAVWGHLLTDTLKKLWFLYTDECRNLIGEGYKIVYVGYNNEAAPDYVHTLLHFAGLELNDYTQIVKPTKCHNLVLPDSSFFPGGCTKEYLGVIDRIKSSISPIECDKIYFARKGCNNAQIEFGEENITTYLGRKGFSIIVPESISIERQIGLLRGCKCFAATEGSISHNSIFCEPGTKHIIIRKTDFVNPYSSIINNAFGLDITYIDSHHSSHLYDNKRPWHGPYYLYVSSHLKRYFGDKGFNQIRWLDRNWYRYILIQHESLHKFLFRLLTFAKSALHQ